AIAAPASRKREREVWTGNGPRSALTVWLPFASEVAARAPTASTPASESPSAVDETTSSPARALLRPSRLSKPRTVTAGAAGAGWGVAPPAGTVASVPVLVSAKVDGTIALAPHGAP